MTFIKTTTTTKNKQTELVHKKHNVMQKKTGQFDFAENPKSKKKSKLSSKISYNEKIA